MTSYSEEIKARYAKTETVTDSHGRKITVRRLRQTEILSARKHAESSDPDVVGYFIVAASLVSIDDWKNSPNPSQLELQANIDLLDEWGIESAANAMQGLRNEKTSEDVAAAAKN